jgi:phosphoribosylaminoimidazole-succinocarboxamide synthase
MNPSIYLGRREKLGDLTLLAAGKVRDIYELDAKRLLFVTSDRVSAFDVILPDGVLNKGRVLTHIAAWWFDRTKDLIANHLLSTDVDDVPGLNDEERAALEGRIMIVKRCQPTPVEWVVRGYIVGSGWKEYQAQGTICDIPLPTGLEFCERLEAPLFTPTTKDDDHDMAISPARAEELVGSEVFAEAHAATLALFARGTEVLASHDMLLADTKFEFGILDGEVLLIDEALTPDSSRFWPAATYQTGQRQPSLDKQILRDWLETLDWNKEAPGPAIDPAINAKLARSYAAICKTLTGGLPAGIVDVEEVGA